MTLDLFWNIFVLTLAHARFIDSVTGDGITVTLFFGERFLNWVDCLFFFFPFSSPTQAAGVAKTTGIPPSEWTTVRNFLEDDHRDSKNHHLFIEAWEEYVAKHFPQPAAAAGSIDTDSMMFNVITEPAPQAAPPPSAP